MDRRKFLIGASAAALAPFAARAAIPANDIDWLVDQLAAHYAYLPDRHIDLAKLRALYRPQAEAARDDHAMLGVLERLLAELHDHHIELTTNNQDSPQLVPTGAEAWASFQDGRAVIEAVRPGSSLERAGAKAGDVVTTIAGIPVREAVARSAPRALSAPDPSADDYTLRVLLAGTHRARRVFAIQHASGALQQLDLPPHQPDPHVPPLTLSRIGSDIACIRVENSLGDSALVRAFDDALADVRSVPGLILDLRNTPSGGNTDVAEPILGRFVRGRPGYQRVFQPGPGRTLARDSYVRWVRERGPFQFTGSLVVLCSRWTGSMGEGMTIGLDAMKRATIVGTRMAGLCGATERFALPNTDIGVQFPTERLYHLDGTPREKFVPPVLVELERETSEDPILTRGIAILRKGRS